MTTLMVGMTTPSGAEPQGNTCCGGSVTSFATLLVTGIFGSDGGSVQCDKLESSDSSTITAACGSDWMESLHTAGAFGNSQTWAEYQASCVLPLTQNSNGMEAVASSFTAYPNYCCMPFDPTAASGSGLGGMCCPSDATYTYGNGAASGSATPTQATDFSTFSRMCIPGQVLNPEGACFAAVKKAGEYASSATCTASGLHGEAWILKSDDSKLTESAKTASTWFDEIEVKRQYVYWMDDSCTCSQGKQLVEEAFAFPSASEPSGGVCSRQTTMAGQPRRRSGTSYMTKNAERFINADGTMRATWCTSDVDATATACREKLEAAASAYAACKNPQAEVFVGLDFWDHFGEQAITNSLLPPSNTYATSQCARCGQAATWWKDVFDSCGFSIGSTVGLVDLDSNGQPNAGSPQLDVFGWTEGETGMLRAIDSATLRCKSGASSSCKTKITTLLTKYQDEKCEDKPTYATALLLSQSCTANSPALCIEATCPS